MALIHPDRRWHGLSGLAVAMLLLLQPVFAAGERREPVKWDADGGLNFDPSGALTLRKPVVRQGTTLLRALEATATGIDGEADNSTWKFTRDVHLEFDGAVLDAQSATVVFVNGRLSSVDIQTIAGQPKKPVHVEFNSAVLDVDTATVVLVDDRIKTIQAQGAPAQFSHVLKKNGRRAQGRSNRIDYDAGKSLVTLSGDTSFSTSVTSGTWDFKTQVLKYNIADGITDSPEKSSGSFSPSAERVPAPRTPDRTSAK